MTLELGIFDDSKLDENFVRWLTEDQWFDLSRHFGRLWEYYQNPASELVNGVGAGVKMNASSRGYFQAQEQGLPARITGIIRNPDGSTRPAGTIQRKEIVIENDIAWRINAMVDFLFGKGVEIVSKAPEVSRRKAIEEVLGAVIAGNGGAGFFQDMAVLGSVYGFVDCMVRFDDELTSLLGNAFASEGRPSFEFTSDSRTGRSFSEVLRLSGQLGLELIEAPRALPILEEHDYRKIRYYIQHFFVNHNSIDRGSAWFGLSRGDQRVRSRVTEIIGKDHWQRYENGELSDWGINPLGKIPVVHVQNIAQPYYYEGLSDVEQLIPLQDELNTRLSDRANRLTLESFKMYLAKGLEGIEDKPVSPGRMWHTDNPEASIEAFGGDSKAPSEDLHISEIRDALDKVSGVSPVVAGLLRDKVGNLTSAVAIRLVFLGMLSKNTRKQFTYGRGIVQIAELVLECLDRLGVFRTEASERKVEVLFQNPLPEDTAEKLKEAQLKLELGVSQESVLQELGYDKERM